ncbi:hypothetical protein HS088_TW21G01317 [Tripterygium wilfordii]|uniref:Uncharacterized protein n=1 Tax=Tripterygium wilfordii TaxID=458696 RepID=A0A7J7C4S2_TRIWF|nr:hypothetical protein HS088_TW21G01317 [Tripterygium wilfordii]
MASEKIPVRFSSCRGVTFEVKPREDPFSITKSPEVEPQGSKRFWLPWLDSNSSKIFPSSLHRSMSRPSSHFCDLDIDDDEDGYNSALEILEEDTDEEKGEPIPLPISLSKREQASKAPPRKPVSRLSVILLDQGLLTVYKRLFVVCLALNISALVLAATGNFVYARNRAALFSIANFLALTLCRSEPPWLCNPPNVGG